MSWPVEFSGIRYYSEPVERRSFLPSNLKRSEKRRFLYGKEGYGRKTKQDMQLSMMRVIALTQKVTRLVLQNQPVKKERLKFSPSY